MSRLLQQALVYASKGWRVFPLAPRKKTPIIAGEPWQHYATTDEEQITAWWTKWPNANVAIVMGPHESTRPEDWIFDFDADCEEGRQFVLKVLGEANTWRFRGAKGEHFICRYSNQLPNLDKANWKIRGEGGKDIIDVKVGNGGGSYVVAPPSIHPDGPTYTDTPGYSSDDFRPVELSIESIAKLHAYSSAGTLTAPHQGRGKRYYEELEQNGADHHSRNVASTELVGHWLALLADWNSENLNGLWERYLRFGQRCRPAMSEAECRTTFDSIYRRESVKRATSTSDRTIGPQKQDAANKTPWRLVCIELVPPLWKLFSPFWEGDVRIVTEQLMDSRRLEVEMGKQKHTRMAAGFRQLWEGNPKGKGQDAIGLCKHLMDHCEREQPDETNDPDMAMIEDLWSSVDETLSHPTRATDDLSEVTKRQGRPILRPNGEVWFQRCWFGALRDPSGNRYETGDLERFFKRFEVHSAPRSVWGRSFRFRWFEKEQFEAFRRLATGA